MVEQGLAQLIMNNVNTKVFAFLLPEDYISEGGTRSAVVYRHVLNVPLYSLQSQNAWMQWQVQLDFHGVTAADCILLSHKVASLLSAWRGTLPDPDATVVTGIFRQPGTVGGYNDSARTSVISIDFKVQYYDRKTSTQTIQGKASIVAA